MRPRPICQRDPLCNHHNHGLARLALHRHVAQSLADDDAGALIMLLHGGDVNHSPNA